jgi:hypothetical protein
MASKYFGPRWAPRRQLQRDLHHTTHDNVLIDLSNIATALEYQAAEFEREREKVMADPDLSAAGKSKALAQVRHRVEREGLKVIEGWLQMGERRVKELMPAVMPKPPRPDSNDTYAVVEFVMRKRDRIARFSALDNGAKLRAVEEALGKCGSAPAARELLCWVMDDDEALAGLPGMAKTRTRIERALCATGNPAAFDELSELLGEWRPDGDERDASTGALSCGRYSMLKFREFLVSEAPDPVRDRQDALREAGATIDKDAVRISSEAARDPQLYRHAREVAMENKVPMIVRDGVVESSIDVSNQGESNGETR